MGIRKYTFQPIALSRAARGGWMLSEQTLVPPEGGPFFKFMYVSSHFPLPKLPRTNLPRLFIRDPPEPSLQNCSDSRCIKKEEIRFHVFYPPLYPSTGLRKALRLSNIHAGRIQDSPEWGSV